MAASIGLIGKKSYYEEDAIHKKYFSSYELKKYLENTDLNIKSLVMKIKYISRIKYLIKSILFD
ncbi:hypothetical protein CWI38_2341p0010 [Hamiltosporidium tvaerminnensis]|uniref:Uncharacterized protein n=1 Tax=Hamiltosporidium tvaerminnensis TaxID=1176355 RepID=A0A4Q9LI69_9MICR|nr:hypothetical protein CWI38_2341p0010 [Hamiltosporidium tvaerminnensis]